MEGAGRESAPEKVVDRKAERHEGAIGLVLGESARRPDVREEPPRVRETAYEEVLRRRRGCRRNETRCRGMLGIGRDEEGKTSAAARRTRGVAPASVRSFGRPRRSAAVAAGLVLDVEDDGLQKELESENDRQGPIITVPVDATTSSPTSGTSGGRPGDAESHERDPRRDEHGDDGEVAEEVGDPIAGQHPPEEPTENSMRDAWAEGLIRRRTAGHPDVGDDAPRAR